MFLLTIRAPPEFYWDWLFLKNVKIKQPSFSGVIRLLGTSADITKWIDRHRIEVGRCMDHREVPFPDLIRKCVLCVEDGPGT